MSTEYEKLKSLNAQAEAEARRFYEKGNKSAGTRLRKILLEIKAQTKAVRDEIQDFKQNNKTAEPF